MTTARHARILWVIFFLNSFCFVVNPANAQYSGGSGTLNDPYQIATAEDLNEIGSNEDDWNKHFVLTEDIDLSAYACPQFNRIGRCVQVGDAKIKHFVGNFDGMNHVIRNFTCANVEGGCNYLALFACLGKGGHVRNLIMENVDVNCPDKGKFLSALVAYNDEGTISNCSISGQIGGNQTEIVGAIVGYSDGGSINNCYVEVDVSGAGRVGGLVGYCRGASISNCHAVISVHGGSWTGGLIGRSQYDCLISGCSITGTVSGGSYLGGLIGESSRCTITDCTAEVEVVGAGYVGGLIGLSGYGAVLDCSATGQVSASGSYVGGLIGGISKGGEVTGCHATGDVSAKAVVGGLIGSIPEFGVVSKCSATGNASVKEKNAGGLAGYSGGRITESYATGGVDSGSKYVGGLVGQNKGTIENSYATGTVTTTAQLVGGLVGSNGATTTKPTVINCYTTGRVNGGEGSCALIGGNTGWVTDCFWDKQTSGWNSCPNGDGMSTEHMMDPDTFLPWACSAPSIWTIDPHRDYPRLAWQLSAGESIDTPALGSLYEGGTGEPNDPYRIATARHLWRIGMYRCDWGKHFTLVADIDLADYSGQPFRPIGRLGIESDDPVNLPFTGVFDGDNRTIGQFKLSDTRSAEAIGLWGWLGGEGQVKNLILRDIMVNASGDIVGGLVGKSQGTISNCCVTGGISGQAFVGGLAGISQGAISNCCVTGRISGQTIVGGLVGEIAGGEVSYCQSGVDLLSEHAGSGGLVGVMNTGTILYCCVTASNISGSEQCAGLVGISNWGIIECSWASCSISGRWALGGIVGKNWDSVIRRCYAIGQIRGEKGHIRNRVGGLVGRNFGGSTIEDCFASAHVVGWTAVGGLVGRNANTIRNTYSSSHVPGGSCESTANIGCLVGLCKTRVINSFWDRGLCPCSSELPESCGAEGKTSSEMRDIRTFLAAGWDFSDTWYMPADGYPQLILFEGTGTPEDPYQLAVAWQLAMVGSDPGLANRHYILINDIDFDPDLSTGQVFDRAVISEFSGTFDGNNHVIRNLRIEGDSNLGLFGVLHNTAVVSDLHIIDAHVLGTGFNIGILAGQNQGYVNSCHTTGAVTGDWSVGGLTGSNGGIITACYSTGSISGTGL
ncbi:GLUG motif-containing protein [Planctomycetota bacterium]